MKYQPPSYSALSQWQAVLRLSRCVTLLAARSEKHLPGCREPCSYLMWNDTYMTVKKKKIDIKNIIVHWAINWNAAGACTSSLICSFSSCFSLFFQQLPFFAVQNLWCGCEENHWSPLVIIEAKPDIWLTGCGPVPSFFSDLNAFACSPRMAGQCVSGPTKMKAVKACQGTEGRVKLCANELLSLQWHFKWLPMGMIISQDTRDKPGGERAGVTSSGCGVEEGKRKGG